MEASKTYKLRDLWQWYTKRIISKVNTLDDLASLEKSGPIGRDDSTIFLSNILYDCEPLLSEEEIKRNLYVEGLNEDLFRLLK